MTATVLSRDLAHQGIQSIDLGHIDIEYEWMLSNVQSKVPIKGKYTNETAVGKIVEQVSDATYKSQIIHILR